jgi:hypothetical protein
MVSHSMLILAGRGRRVFVTMTMGDVICLRHSGSHADGEDSDIEYCMIAVSGSLIDYYYTTMYASAVWAFIPHYLSIYKTLRIGVFMNTHLGFLFLIDHIGR